MDQIQSYTFKLEDTLDKLASPLKPHIPTLARFLLVVTFLEDSVRLVMQWSSQLYYMQQYRGFPAGVSHLFLLANVGLMVGCSGMAIARKHTELAVGGLFLVVVSQALAYGFVFDFNFFMRNMSIIGALLLLLSESLSASRRKSMFAGLPTLSEVDRSQYFQLAGRVLLILLFLSFILSGEMTLLRGLVSLVGLIACVMVVVGFKAKWSAMFLVLFLSIFNVLINNWWDIDYNPTHRDFVKYDFFQTLSIMGGLLLLVSLGPGGISVDEKKKAF
ncbi:ER-derived vesicles protein erv29 [Dimargaris cristalligena]|uniref:SURF4 family-domain-containing protein n=1 Tax=Dimargaris cristalligena TaxID=215637 RepID=A0A4Q0A0W8_9FUNG|nr:ER-derived vesicles protein erv29 [Dimargaris cristalligena]RKP39081.1 SURF4 family-domain-containing protein [Dimargaris cristalligena]|eukprot:RKP39081.1 SURF4 family-domain-containing protein [Dimargaris cristalligena]